MARGAVRPGDGRLARSERTRTAAAQALLDLVREGDPSPTVEAVARRAGVTARSLYVHFPSAADLHRAAAARATAEVVSLISPIDLSADLHHRIAAVCRQRAVVHEHLAPIRSAARAMEATSPALAEARATALRASRDQVERVFGAELAALTPAARRRRIAALDAVLGDEAWALWRTHHGLSVRVATATMVEALTAQLEHG